MSIDRVKFLLRQPGSWHASLEEMIFLEAIGEVSAKRIIAIRETGMPLTIHDDDEVDAKSVVTSTADQWYSILKSERVAMDRI